MLLLIVAKLFKLHNIVVCLAHWLSHTNMGSVMGQMAVDVANVRRVDKRGDWGVEGVGRRRSEI